MSRAPWPPHKKIDFSQVDWSRSNKEIAFELKCDPSLASRKRRPNLKVGHTPVNFSKVDWGLPVKAIAHELGCSEAYVYSNRPKDFRLRHRAYDFSKVDWTRTNEEIARAAGVSSQAVASYRRYHNLPRPLEKWRMIDPRLTIRENAKKLGRSEASVYSMAHSRGMRFKKIKPGRPRSRSPLTPAQ
jgi:hypothetical protein